MLKWLKKDTKKKILKNHNQIARIDPKKIPNLKVWSLTIKNTTARKRIWRVNLDKTQRPLKILQVNALELAGAAPELSLKTGSVYS